MVYTHYGHGQKWGLGIVWLGLVVCVIASSVPYWYKVKVAATTGLLNSVKAKFELNAGVWAYCLRVEASSAFQRSSAETCQTNYRSAKSDDYHFGFDDNNQIYTVRGAVAISGIISLLCAIVSCCRSSSSRTVVHGVFVLISAGIAFIAVGLMASKGEEILLIPDQYIDLDWALGLYSFGAGLYFIAAIILMLSPPGEMSSVGVVVHNPGTMMTVVTTNQMSVPQQMPPQFGAPQYGAQPYGAPPYGALPYAAPQYEAPPPGPAKY